MFDDCIFSTYGRGKIGKNWHISDDFGSNRIYYIHSGDAFYTGNGKKIKLKTGHLYLFPQNLKFELEFDETEVIDHTYFDFVTTPPIKLDNFIEIDLESNEIIKSASKILLELGEKYPISKGKEYKELIKSYTINLLALIDKKVKIETIIDERINEIIKYIHKNINKTITIKELSSICCVEENYFIRLFKKNMSVSPQKYIRHYKLKLAMSYLDRNFAVGEVAEKIGYSDVASFSHAFKKECGIYPSEYIKKEL